MPPQDPLTRLQLMAIEITQFADALDAETDLDSTLMRLWASTLIEIAQDLQRLRAGSASA